MRISVVIPVFNKANTIIETLNSCLNQSFKPFEIIVINDASTDNTLDKIHFFLNKIKIINLNTNIGVSAARNKGWEESIGDYVCFLDGDDIWHPDKLKIISKLFTLFPNFNAIAHAFTADNNMLNNATSTDIKLCSTLDFTSLLIRNKVQGSCIAVKRDYFIHFDDNLRYSEDYDWALRASFQKTIIFYNTPLSLILRPMLSKGGISSNRWDMRKGELYSFFKLYKLNPLFFLLIPILVVYSFLKHLISYFPKK